MADDALMAAQRLAKPGTPEQVVLAGMQSAVFQGGGDYPASRFIIGSGENALMVRSFSGYRTLGAKDQLQLEFGGTYRQYHPCLMRTILTGEPSQQQLAMHAACCDALQASKAADRPGSTFGDIFAAHADSPDRSGFGEHRLNACGYSLGALYPPTWMDWPMKYKDNQVVLEPNMLIFMYMVLLDWERKLAMAVGDTDQDGDGPDSKLTIRPNVVDSNQFAFSAIEKTPLICRSVLSSLMRCQ